MVKKQITFEDRTYLKDERAIEWLLNLSKCFFIKKAKITSYKRKDGTNCTRVEVQYE